MQTNVTKRSNVILKSNYFDLLILLNIKAFSQCCWFLLLFNYHKATGVRSFGSPLTYAWCRFVGRTQAAFARHPRRTTSWCSALLSAAKTRISPHSPDMRGSALDPCHPLEPVTVEPPRCKTKHSAE